MAKAQPTAGKRGGRGQHGAGSTAPGAPLTRRALVGGAACSLALALAGCSGAGGGSGSEDSDTRVGFTSDCERKSYPVELTVYFDSYVQYHNCIQYDWLDETGFNSAGDAPANYAEHLCACYRYHVDDTVSFQVELVEPFELLALCEAGFADGDGVIALDSTITAGNDAGTLDGGEEEWMVRDLGYHISDVTYLVRAKGTDHQLPDADTYDGEDSVDGSFNRLQKLPEYDGLVAVADPEGAVEGIYANAVLEAQGFYSAEEGYSEDVADKIVVYSSQEEAMAAVAAEECQLGFAFRSNRAALYPDVEKAYKPPNSHNVSYSGCAIAGAPEPGVFRDFVEFLANNFTG